MAEMECRSVQEDRPSTSTSAGQSDCADVVVDEVMAGVDFKTLL